MKSRFTTRWTDANGEVWQNKKPEGKRQVLRRLTSILNRKPRKNTHATLITIILNTP